MKDVFGQERVANWLQMAHQQGRLAHAYLFTGSSAGRMKQMALELAKMINCEHHMDDACDHCATCMQIDHGNHPEIMTISPDGAYIKINQVRAVQTAFRFRAQEGVTRVLIIESAERMRMETANSILKFLEEPISPMIVILLTEKKERVLPTIRSRCGWVRFSPEPLDLLLDRYRQLGFEPVIARLLANLATVEELLELSSEELNQFISQIIDWANDILMGNEDAILQVQVGFIAKEVAQGRAKSVAELLLLWLREAITQEGNLFAEWERETSSTNKITKDKILLAIDNVMIVSRLLQKAELSGQAILEQMVLTTQAGKISTENDWRLIVI